MINKALSESKTPSKSLLAVLGTWEEEPLGELQDALFTTYNLPDTSFLINELLPRLLFREGLPEDGDENRAVVQLRDKLEHMPEKPIIVSSFETCPDATKDAWLWGPIQHHSVGKKRGLAFQHSKLWLLKWGNQVGSSLEVVISSCNLTSGSLSKQQQGIWRCVVPINSSTRLAEAWSPMPEFLEKLADSCGHPEIRRFNKLLDSAVCPKDIKFIASVPGPNTDGTWGWTALQNACPKHFRKRCHVTVVAPSIGNWKSPDLKSMMPGRLAWVSDSKNWKEWNLPKSTLKAIEAERTWSIHELQWPLDGNDGRWLHAKLYLLRARNWRRLLITSANFSPSAWGRKNIRNFELGVLIRGELPFDLKEPEEGIQWALNEEQTEVVTDAGWAEAEWDGKKLTVRCRSSLKILDLGIIYSGGKSWTSDKKRWKSVDGLKVAETLIAPEREIPVAVRITLDGGKPIEVAVMDLRKHPGTEAMVGPVLTKEAIEQMRIEVLLERYGGWPLPSGDVLRDWQPFSPGKKLTSDYSLPAFREE